MVQVDHTGGRHVPSHHSQQTCIVSQKDIPVHVRHVCQFVLHNATRDNLTSRHLGSDWTLCLAQRIGSRLPELWSVAMMDSTPGLSSLPSFQYMDWKTDNRHNFLLPCQSYFADT